MDEQILEAMAKSGCTNIYYGIESGSEDILKKISKGFTAKDAQRVVLQTKKYIKNVVASFIYGFPFESLDNFYDTLLLSVSLANQGINSHFHLLSPLPLTPLYQSYKDKISFSQELLSDIAWPRSLGNLPQEALAIIEQYPEIFSSFYHFDSPDLLKKKSCVDKTSKQEG